VIDARPADADRLGDPTYPGTLRGLLGGDEGRRGARRACSGCRHVRTALAASGREGETPTAPRVKKPKGSAIGYTQAAARRGENRNPGPVAAAQGTGVHASDVGSRGRRAQLHKPSKVTPHSQPSGNRVNRAATAARRVRTTVRGVYVAGVLFDPLRHFLVAHSYPAHLLANVRVAHSLGSSEDIFGAYSKVTGEQSKIVGHCRRL
jgi:hypothetical protein